MQVVSQNQPPQARLQLEQLVAANLFRQLVS
jgi:hypothetical protein